MQFFKYEKLRGNLLKKALAISITEKPELTEFLDQHHLAEQRADSVYLLPPEFGHEEYKNQFEKSCATVMETSGLLYDPVPENELSRAPYYEDLKKTNKENHLVIVFGGGGTVWDEFVLALHHQADALKDKKMSLLLKDKYTDADGKEKLSKRTWRLYTPENIKGKKLSDPGRLIYWYHACTLLLVRGGLAAQQILAAAFARPSDPPGMIFVNEPNHPQINAEWKLLNQMKLVYAVDFRKFDETVNGNGSTGAIDFIENYIGTGPDKVLEKKNERLDFHRRASLRYAEGAIDKLADSILGTYNPIAPSSNGIDCRFDDGREFLEMLGDFIRFGDIGSAPRPFLLQVMVPDSSENDWRNTDLDMLKKVVVSFKQNVKTIFFSNIDSSGVTGSSGKQILQRQPDPLKYPHLDKIIEKAREGVNIEIGIETMLNDSFENYKSSINKLFENPGSQDYINIFLDAGTEETYNKVWKHDSRKTSNDNQIESEPDLWKNLIENLTQLSLKRKGKEKEKEKKGVQNAYVHIQLLYSLKDVNCEDGDIYGAIGLLKKHEGIDRLVFSYDDEVCAQKNAADRIKENMDDIDGKIQLIRRRNWKKSNFQSCSACLFFPTVFVEGGKVNFCACPNVAPDLESSKCSSCTWSSMEEKTPFDIWKEDVPGKEDAPEKKWKKFAGDLPAKCGRICSQKAGTINAMADAMLTGIRMIG